MDNNFAIHIDCDPLSIYEKEYSISIGSHDLIYTQALPKALNLLNKLNIKATFFIIGSELQNKNCVDFCKTLLKDGHLIGNHSHNHYNNFGNLKYSDIQDEIETSHKIIKLKTGFTPKGFRAPGYGINNHVFKSLEKLNYLYDSSVLPGHGTLLMYIFNLLKGPKENKKSFSVLKNFFSSRKVRQVKQNLLEIPIATFPWLRLPVHPTFLYKFGNLYKKIAFIFLAKEKNHHVFILHAIDFLDHPKPSTFEKKVISMEVDYKKRLDIIFSVFKNIKNRAVLTEEYFKGK